VGQHEPHDRVNAGEQDDGDGNCGECAAQLPHQKSV
jgi:hypothetical protein